KDPGAGRFRSLLSLFFLLHRLAYGRAALDDTDELTVGQSNDALDALGDQFIGRTLAVLVAWNERDDMIRSYSDLVAVDIVQDEEDDGEQGLVHTSSQPSRLQQDHQDKDDHDHADRGKSAVIPAARIGPHRRAGDGEDHQDDDQ